MQENILLVDNSNNSPKSVKPSTKKGRDRKKRNALSQTDLIEILQSTLLKMQESGIGVAIVPLPQRALPSAGIVLANVEVCRECSKLVSTTEGATCARANCPANGADRRAPAGSK